MVSIILTGTPQDETEMSLEPWLQSPLLSGGIQASQHVMEASDWQSLGRRRWEQAFRGEQEGRLVRTRSFMDWSSREDGGALKAHDDAGYASSDKENANDEGRFVSQSRREIRLSVKVAWATKLPTGLVLWPDDPYICLTAVLDGRYMNSSEELLVHTESVTNVHASPTTHDEGEMKADQQWAECEHKSLDEEAVEKGQVRVGRKLHVFMLQIPERTVFGTVKGQEDAVPSISLRVLVKVGNITTASGEVDVPEAQTSGSTLTALRLDSGGEICLAVDLVHVDSRSLGSRENAHENRSGKHARPAAFNAGSVRMSDPCVESRTREVFCSQKFLSSIVSSGSRTDEDPVSSSCNAGDASQHSSSHVSREASTNIDGDESELIVEVSGGSLYQDLVEWLGRSHPDPPFLRAALEKTGNYSFPLVEAPFLAALLKHGGLVDEAFEATKIMYTTREGKWLMHYNTFIRNVDCGHNLISRGLISVIDAEK